MLNPHGFDLFSLLLKLESLIGILFEFRARIVLLVEMLGSLVRPIIEFVNMPKA